MSARAEHIRAKLRAVSIASVLMHGMPSVTGQTTPVAAPEPMPEQPGYAQARTESLEVLARLGAEPPLDGVSPEVADLVRQAYALGWAACEKKVLASDTADAVAIALDHPELVVEKPDYAAGQGTGNLRWQVRAAQHAAVYGVPKELGARE